MTSKFLRFILVGGLNTAVSYAAYAGLLFLGLPYAVANFLALVVGITLGFKTQGRLVFDNPDNRMFVKFVALWAVVYIINVALIRAFLNLGMNAYVAGALALPLIALFSFLGQDRLVFRRIGNGRTSELDRAKTRTDIARGGE